MDLLYSVQELLNTGNGTPSLLPRVQVSRCGCFDGPRCSSLFINRLVDSQGMQLSSCLSCLHISLDFNSPENSERHLADAAVLCLLRHNTFLGL